MSEAPTPSDSMAASFEGFLDLRRSLCNQRIGAGGSEVCQALTTELDRAIVTTTTAVESPLPYAIVALGGYGRSELSPFSDVDIMVLHEPGDASDLAAAVFRPMWDANLKLGHAVRTVDEAAHAARERFDSQTTLLTSRLVSGKEELFTRLKAEVGAVTRARPLRRYLIGEELNRRHDSPYLMMATDVKNGRGGLRTLQGFQWERLREELIGRFSSNQTDPEPVAHEDLLRIRNALHSCSGRHHDVFSPELRDGVAAWLGVDTYEAAETMVRATRTVDALATSRWPELLDSADPVTRIGKKLWSSITRRPTPSATTPPIVMGDLAVILRSGENGRAVLDRLDESGKLVEILPEWGDIKNVPQLAPFHEHPVGSHLWRTVDEMTDLVNGEDRHYRQIASEVDSADLLTVVAFLHDIGKGHGGHHSKVGAGIAAQVCQRLGLPADTSSIVEDAVRLHLLLSETATRRDISDPAVIDDVVGAIGSLQLLQVLYLLSVADSKATGTTMWNDWKATLLRTTFLNSAARFGADQPLETTLEDVVMAGGAEKRARIEAHIDAMPPDYLRGIEAEDVVWHIDLIAQFDEATEVKVRPGDPPNTAVVIGRFSAGLRTATAGAFASNGIDVLEARLQSRSDGLVIDTFLIRDDRTHETVRGDRVMKARQDIEDAMAGRISPHMKISERAAAYEMVGAPTYELRVDASIDPASDDLIVTIRCADRVGRLFEMLEALDKAGLQIRLAKLDTRGGEVVDTFHIRRHKGDPEEHTRLRELEIQLRQAIKP